MNSQNVNKEDRAGLNHKVDSLIKFSYASSDSNVIFSFNLADSARNLATRINYQKGALDAMILMGRMYYARGKYYSAISTFLKCIDICKQYNDFHNLGATHERIGYILILLNQVDQAYYYVNTAKKFADNANDTTTLILIYFDYGLIAQQQHDHPKAARNFLFGYYLGELSGNYSLSHRALKLMGTLFLEENNLNKSMMYYRLAETVAEKNNLFFELGTINSHLAHVYSLLKDYRLSLKYDFRAAEIRKEAHQGEQYISSLLNIGNDYMLLTRYDSALFFVNRGLSLISDQEMFHVQEYGYSLQTSIFTAMGRYQEALASYYQYSVARDSSLLEKNRQEIATIQSKQRLLETEQRNKLLEYQVMVQNLEIQSKKRQTVIFFLIITIVLVISAILYWLYLKTKRSRQALQALNEQLDREVEERKKAEIALRISESSYRFLADHTPDVILQMDPAGQVIFASPNCREVLGYTAEELADGFPFEKTVFPEYLEAMKGLYRIMVATCEPTLFTYEALSKTGTRFWVESLANPLTDPVTGKYNGCISVLRNIEERVQYEEQLAQNAKQKEVLLREVHHRVKNNFAILIGVLTLQKSARHNPELANLVNDLELRIRSMSLVHELLYRHENLDFIPFDTYVVQLANIVAAANRSKTVHIIPNTQPCSLDIETALPLGLVVNELVTNSFKYAFTEEGDGYLFIDLFPYETDPAGMPVKWILTLRDNGKGLPDGFTMDSTGTLGSQIVQMLVTQVEGSVRTVSNGGACFEIIFSQSPE